MKLFLYLFFTSVDHGHRHGYVLGVVRRVADLDWISGGGAAHGRSPSPFFIERGYCIGMRDISNTPASSTLLSIFIQQIQSSP